MEPRFEQCTPGQLREYIHAKTGYRPGVRTDIKELRRLAEEASGRKPANVSEDKLPPSNSSGSSIISEDSRLPSDTKIQTMKYEFDWRDVELIKTIGRGSFGIVYLGRYREAKVAVKVLYSDVSDKPIGLDSYSWNKKMVDELLAEAGLMADMRHPNIVCFMGVSTQPHPAIITEYCSNGSLADVVEKARASPQAALELTWRIRLKMLKEAATGVYVLHKSRPPIIHRDLKSPNLLVDRNMTVKIADFNLSKIVEGDGAGGETMAEMNPRWLAPEILGAEKATFKSDVFSMGIIMHELLTWDVPWRKTSAFAIGIKVRKGERPNVPQPNKLPGGVFNNLSAYISLMERCWHQDPDKRPDMQQVIVEVREMLHQLP